MCELDEASVDVEIDAVAVANYGLSAARVREAILTLVWGHSVGIVRTPYGESEVFVQLLRADEGPPSLDELGDLPIATPTGEEVLVKEVAELRIAPQVVSRFREDGKATALIAYDLLPDASQVEDDLKVLRQAIRDIEPRARENGYQVTIAVNRP